MARRKKYPKLPNGFGSIKYLGKNRRNPYAVHPPTEQFNIDGIPQTPKALCYVDDWMKGFAILTAYKAGTYYPGMEKELLVVPDPDSRGLVQRILADFSVIRGAAPEERAKTFREVYEEFYDYKFNRDKSRTYSSSTMYSARAAFHNCSALHDREFRSLRHNDLQDVIDECPLKHSSLELIVSNNIFETFVSSSKICYNNFTFYCDRERLIMKATIVIPNYNGKHFMKPCLDSLAMQTCRDFKILVVDNASSDGSISYMKEHYPDIELIALDENYGFSKAVNVGISHARTPYVILLNNDTTAGPHYVEEMIKAIEQSPDIFSVSSKMIQMYHPDLIDSAGDIYTLPGWAICRGAGRSVTEYTLPCQIFSACAGAAIYRRSVFSEIGLFDENHFAYLEDVDIGYRAKIYGYKNMFCPSALVCHVGSGTSGSRHNAFKVRLAARNTIYVNYKNMPFLQLVLNFIPLSAGCLIKYIFFVRKGLGAEYRKGILEGLKTRKAQKKVPFQLRHLKHYIKIEIEMISHTFSCVKHLVHKAEK